MSAASPQKEIRKRTWSDFLAQADVSKGFLNGLIYEFLTVEGYLPAAQAFEAETGFHELGSKRVSEQDEARSHVLRSILCGKPDQSLLTISKQFPGLLDEAPKVAFELHKHAACELLRKGRHGEALKRVYTSVRPIVDASSELRSDLEVIMQAIMLADVTGSAPDERRLSQCGESHESGPSADATETEGGVLNGSVLPQPHHSSAGLSASSPSTTGLAKASAGPSLSAAAELGHSQASTTLPRQVRQVLSITYRGHVADEVNQAILARQGRLASTRLPLMLRMLQWAQSRLGEEGIEFPTLSSAEVSRGGMVMGSLREAEEVATGEVAVMRLIAECAHRAPAIETIAGHKGSSS